MKKQLLESIVNKFNKFKYNKTIVNFLIIELFDCIFL